jgi:rhodanese-related sulfurtransferase
MNRVWRQDLVWAAVILGLAVVIGLVQQWPLVHQSWQGQLPALLAQARQQRRQQEFQGVKTLNLAQAYARFQQGQTLFIDARPPDEFAEIHVPKALNITPEMLKQKGAANLAGIAKNREIVVYCSQASCNLSLEVAEKLQALGFTRVSAFMGGWRAWNEAGYPAATSK